MQVATQGTGKNSITWIDSTSPGTLTYRVKRGTINDAGSATVIANNLGPGVEAFTDSTAVSLTIYYYFVEVTDGTNSAVSSNFASIKTAMINNYRSADADLFAYDPATDSFM